jgi:hypothetical protein
MKIQTLFFAILGTLLISGLSLSQEPESAAPPLPESPVQGTPLQRANTDRTRTTDRSSSGREMVTRIFVLRNVSVNELQDMLTNVLNINKVYSDRRSNRLIVQATQGQMEEIARLIEMMDVTDSRSAITQAIQNLVYRVYMFEIPSNDKGNKSFSMILQTPAQVPSTQLLGLAEEKGIQVSDFLVSNEENEEPDRKVEFLIQGKAPSNESIMQMVMEIAESQIRELKWDDSATFTRGIGAAQYSQLPEQVQKYIKKFLGEDIETVGYWFGSSSVPGKVEAPIGPWILRLELETESDRELELRVEVEVPERNYDFERRLGHEERDGEILSNTVRAKIGKPIIIGYNRQSYRTRKMGAMVILPETIQLDTSEPTKP